MPAGLTKSDSMFSVREVPWHKMGVVLPEPPKNIDEAIDKCSLGWEVVQQTVYVQVGDKFVPVPGRFANLRSDTKDVMGVVGEKYRILQNREAFSWLSNLIGSEMHFETAGSLHGGKQVWVMASLPEWVEIGGDPVKTYVFITNSHDGLRAVRAAVSPIRIVCQNTLTWALQSAQRTYAVTHIGDPTSRLQEARRVLEVSIDYSKQFKELGDKLASQKMSEASLKKVLEQLWPTEGPAMTDRKKANAVDAHNHIVWLWKEGDTKGNAPGTKWTAANVIAEYVDYGAPSTEDEVVDRNQQKLTRAMYDPSGKKQKAFELVTAA